MRPRRAAAMLVVAAIRGLHAVAVAEEGCQSEIELPVPPAAVSEPALVPGSPAKVGGLWNVTPYTDSSLLVQIPNPPVAAFDRRTVVYIAGKEGYQTAETSVAGLPLWQFLVPGTSTDRPIVAAHLLPYTRVISAHKVFVSIAGAYLDCLALSRSTGVRQQKCSKSEFRTVAPAGPVSAAGYSHSIVAGGFELMS